MPFGEHPGEETLEGLCAPRPLYFAGREAQNPHRDFRMVAELGRNPLPGRAKSRRSASLLMDLAVRHGESSRLPAWAETFHPLIFQPVVRAILGSVMSAEPLAGEEAKALLPSGPPERQGTALPYGGIQGGGFYPRPLPGVLRC